MCYTARTLRADPFPILAQGQHTRHSVHVTPGERHCTFPALAAPRAPALSFAGLVCTPPARMSTVDAERTGSVRPPVRLMTIRSIADDVHQLLGARC